jgi:Holliday junction resolvase-like predicted endonuclease
MSEQKVQAKILRWLEAEGHYVIKVVTANRAGVPDIIGCTKDGVFFGIEVKFGRNQASELQKYHLKEIDRCGGIAVLAYDLETVKKAIGE